MMNRILLILLFLVCAGTVAQAQRLSAVDDELDKLVIAVELSGPQMAILEMQRELKLNDAQLRQVEKLNEERFARMSEAEVQIDDPLELQEAFRKINGKLDRTLARILNESQWLHYLELEGKQHLILLTGTEEE